MIKYIIYAILIIIFLGTTFYNIKRNSCYEDYTRVMSQTGALEIAPIDKFCRDWVFSNEKNEDLDIAEKINQELKK